LMADSHSNLLEWQFVNLMTLIEGLVKRSDEQTKMIKPR